MDLRLSQFIHEWETYFENDADSQIESLLDGQNLIMFFKKDGKVYGVSEDGRLTFARMKDKKDDEISDEWKKEANFTALDLSRALEGVKTHNVFGHKDMKSIDVIDRDEAKSTLLTQAKKLGTVKAGEIEPEDDNEEDPGVPLSDEK